MKSLILADLKVLGHRLWTIPIGVFLFIFSFSFIPYLNQVQQFQNWIFAILIPGLLTFELLREEQKNKSDSMLMTMPVSKEKYVWSKYILLITFSLIGFLFGEASNKTIEIFNLYYAENYILRYFSAMYYTSFTVLKLLFIAFPIYLYSRQLKISFIIAPLIMFGLVYLYLNLFVTLRYQALYSYSLGFAGYYINIMFLVIAVLFVHAIIIYKFKKFLPIMKHLWFLVIILVFIMTNDILREQVSMSNHYYEMKKLSIEKADIWKESKLTIGSLGSRYANLLDYALKYCEKEEYRFILSFSVVIITSLLLLILHKSPEKKFMNLIILFFLMPIIMLIFEKYIIFFLRLFIKEYVYYYPDLGGAPLYLYSLTIGSFLYMYISARASVYLLKNNRTLK